MIKILVTGSHRSGTTWVGKMLTINNKNIYIHEPNNLDDRIKFNKYKTTYWFEYLTRDIISGLDEDFRKLNYPLIVNLKRSKSFKDLLKSTYYYFLYTFSKIKGGYNVVVKDPISIFNIDHYLDLDYYVVVSQRNPFSFISSLYVKGWSFDFNHISLQEELMLKFPEEIQKQIKIFSNSENIPIIDQGILLWNMFMVFISKKDNDKLVVINHEEFSRNPLIEFKKLYSRLGLDFDYNIERVISETTMVSSIPENEKSNDLVRNSRRNLNSFKRRLSNEEILSIYKGTQKYYPKYYSTMLSQILNISLNNLEKDERSDG